MVKKGKYKLFNYLIENHLIYYKGLRKNDKIIAFAILDYIEFNKLETLLKDLLKNKFIQYYAIQIAAPENNGNLLFLNFEDNTKERIVKSFNFVQQKIIEAQILAKFQKEKNLEENFLSIISLDKSSNTTITKISESLKISDENNTKLLNFFLLNLDVIEKKESFIINFLNLIKNLESEGVLIFNFKINNNDEIKVYPYFVENRKNPYGFSNIEKKINNFFQMNLIEKRPIKIGAISNYLWRLEISNNFYILNGCFNHFFPKASPNILDFSIINEEIEQNLQKNKIEYIRLGKNLIFIEQKYLFIILDNLDSKYIIRILKKYYPKYIIFILIVKESGHKKLIEANKIKLIENIKIVHPQDIQNFNYQEFKRNL